MQETVKQPRIRSLRLTAIGMTRIKLSNGWNAHADNAYHANEASSASRYAATDADDQDHAEW